MTSKKKWIAASVGAIVLLIVTGVIIGSKWD